MSLELYIYVIFLDSIFHPKLQLTLGARWVVKNIIIKDLHQEILLPIIIDWNFDFNFFFIYKLQNIHHDILNVIFLV